MSNENQELVKKIIEQWNKEKNINVLKSNIKIPIREIKFLLFQYGEDEGKKVLIEILEEKLPIRKIVGEYNNGKKINDLAKEFGKNSFVIKDAIRMYEMITNQHIIRKKEEKAKLPMEEIIERHNNGEPYYKIAETYKVANSTIYRKVMNYQFEKNGEGRDNNKTRMLVNEKSESLQNEGEDR